MSSATHLGKQISACREAQKLTLQDLANRIGSSKSWVWQLENQPGIRPSYQTVVKLAKALGSTPGMLIGEPELGYQAMLYFQKYQQLSKGDQRRVWAIMSAFADLGADS